MERAVAPAAERNKQPIADVLSKYIAPEAKQALELASGTGQHIAYFAALYPDITWQPSDLTTDLFPSIQSYAADLNNVNKPIAIDASKLPWPITGPLDVVLCINMTHISPWEATIGLMAAAGQLLRPEGVLFVYGPFLKDGKPTTESNAQFDASLKVRNPSWGYRDIDSVKQEAANNGLKLSEVLDMPANNFSLVFHKLP